MITLIKIIEERTRTGGVGSKVDEEREVFADEKSVRMTEFYTAYQSGFEARKVFKIHKEEYRDERVLLHDESYYTIIRTYVTGDFIELTCTKRQGVFEEVRV